MLYRAWLERCAAAAQAPVIQVGGAELFLGDEAMVFPVATVDIDAVIGEIQAGLSVQSLLCAAGDLLTALVSRQTDEPARSRDQQLMPTRDARSPSMASNPAFVPAKSGSFEGFRKRERRDLNPRPPA
jgi:hypothetical protein